MQQHGTWISVSECAEIYNKSRNWVDNRIKRHKITTKRAEIGNKKLIQIVDFIAHCGEPVKKKEQHNAEQDNGAGQESTVAEVALLRQENAFLKQRIAQLEALDAERSRLLGIIERQNLALPPPDDGGKQAGHQTAQPEQKHQNTPTDQRGVYKRFTQWVNSRL